MSLIVYFESASSTHAPVRFLLSVLCQDMSSNVSNSNHLCDPSQASVVKVRHFKRRGLRKTKPARRRLTTSKR
ncbi:hypothetical protein HPP92_024563 [Vanilla planifolia]|uniref:Uncharacterized protein n=1 Tax=Vanilla planifolia TaxID=51239 RepID=A0A835UBY1_VANPL|nr:hypothetical protein HPP92_024867 [Vanilla planifolia]KAG0456775.1 hypothetical protein HPP92_024563 [Vanilla planifolia]